ncbi:hypothetical protein ACIQNG_32760 [Streptomyces sp. NPDC091377]|uniref:hypothetical protein n=1 Tax=Streptomyces sp. NPDC091377 TaxID=3365995 RepID=UPI0038282ABB
MPLGSTTYYFASLEELGREALALLGNRAEADLREIAGELAVFVDGAATHAVLHDAPLTREFLTDVVAKLLCGAATVGER